MWGTEGCVNSHLSTISPRIGWQVIGYPKGQITQHPVEAGPQDTSQEAGPRFGRAPSLSQPQPQCSRCRQGTGQAQGWGPTPGNQISHSPQ